MITKEFAKVCDYLSGRVTIHSDIMYKTGRDGERVSVPCVNYDELMAILANYFAERNDTVDDKACGPDYEVMCKKQSATITDLHFEIDNLKSDAEYLREELYNRDVTLEKYAAMLETVEVMTGNKFSMIAKRMAALRGIGK
jgi:hypothetical protein